MNLALAQGLINDFATQNGVEVSFIESTGETNERGEIIKNVAPAITVRCYPVYFSPGKKQREKAGIDEPVDVIVWMSHIKFLESGLNEDIVNTIMKIQGKVYNVKSFQKKSNFFNSTLYVIFTGDKK